MPPGEVPKVPRVVCYTSEELFYKPMLKSFIKLICRQKKKEKEKSKQLALYIKRQYHFQKL